MKNRRARPIIPHDAALGPAWARLVLGAGLLLAGIAALWISGSELLQWAAALQARAEMVRTDSGMFGMPLLGLAFIGFAGLSLLPARTGRQEGWWIKVMWTAALLLTGAGMIATMAGSSLTRAMMRAHGYHRCSSDLGIRTASTIWSLRTCPPGSIDRR